MFLWPLSLCQFHIGAIYLFKEICTHIFIYIWNIIKHAVFVCWIVFSVCGVHVSICMLGYFKATFVHKVGQMSSNGNETVSKMKHPSDMHTPRFELRWLRSVANHTTGLASGGVICMLGVQEVMITSSYIWWVVCLDFALLTSATYGWEGRTLWKYPTNKGFSWIWTNSLKICITMV